MMQYILPFHKYDAYKWHMYVCGLAGIPIVVSLDTDVAKWRDILLSAVKYRGAISF